MIVGESLEDHTQQKIDEETELLKGILGKFNKKHRGKYDKELNDSIHKVSVNYMLNSGIDVSFGRDNKKFNINLDENFETYVGEMGEKVLYLVESKDLNQENLNQDILKAIMSIGKIGGYIGWKNTSATMNKTLDNYSLKQTPSDVKELVNYIKIVTGIKFKEETESKDKNINVSYYGNTYEKITIGLSMLMVIVSIVSIVKKCNIIKIVNS